ncbi:MAG: O-antigen ligase family protein [Candidimonas sp.]|nr:O-antigen ligase family protein [Candidimonas sp.]
MQDYSLGQLIVAVRSPGENFPFRIFYPDIVGNWNKAANVIVLGMLIAVYSIAANRRQSGQAHIALSLLSILLFLSFSRGAMVVITILLIPLWYVFILRAEHFKAVKPRLALSIIAAPVLLSLALPDMRSHWLQLGSMQSRVEQWNRVVAASASTSSSYLDMVFGGGAGSYGMETSGSAASGTHNLFLDTYLWGGALGLTGLTLLLVAYPGVMFSRTLLSGGQFSVRQITGLLGVVAIFTLGMREFDLSYLHVTAIPAILTGLFIGLTGDDGKKPRDLPLSWPVRSRAT